MIKGLVWNDFLSVKSVFSSEKKNVFQHLENHSKQSKFETYVKV